MQNKIYLFSISSHPKAIHINPLQIDFFQPDIDFSKYDNIIITSQQASKALSFYKTDDYKEKEAICVSTKSADSYEKIGGSVLEIGSGYGDDLSAIIQKYPKERRWLYLRAKVVASDFVEKCKNKGYSIDEIVVYESRCSEKMANLNIEVNATLIFTSPSSLKCYLQHTMIQKTNKVIVIGKTTAKALPDGIEYTLAKETTIESCIDAL